MTSEAARAWFPHFDWLWRSMMRSGRRLRRLHSSSANLQARCVFLGKSSQEISASLTKRCVSQDFADPRPRGEVGGACTRKRGSAFSGCVFENDAPENYFSELLIEENLVLSLPPRPLTAAMIASAI